MVSSVKYCRRSTQLHVNIRNPISYNLYHPPCPTTCPSSPLHITFVTHSNNLYLDSSTNSPIAEHQEVTGEKTICADSTLFFSDVHKSYMDVSEVLDSLNVKKYLYHKIFRQLMSFGERRNKKKKKMFKSLLVSLTLVRKFVGDQVSVHEVIEKSWKDREIQLREEGVQYLNVTLA